MLVVDDNADNRALAAEILGEEGVVVALAATGGEAVAAFERERPECVLLDINLPDIDGIAICERLRALPGGAEVAIVFVTSRRDVEAFDRALRAGGDDFLTKPYRPNELLVRIHTARRLRDMTAERGALATEIKRQRDELQRVQLQKEQLTEFLVHDLKNPVHAIELLARRVMQKDGDVSNKIREESRGLMRMITNLLDITKANDGTLRVIRRDVDLHELIRGAVGDLETHAATAGVIVETQVTADRAMLDRDLVHRVLANLVENALRHAPEGSRVRVQADRGLAGLTIRVSDGGPGVPEDLRVRVFERLVTTGPRGSHGLGLAFCRVAVEAHGGRIWVEDGSPGAVFAVELPDAG